MGFEHIGTTGRLVMTRIFSPNQTTEVPQYFHLLLEQVKRIPEHQFISFVDVRGITLLPPQVAESYISAMKRDNPALLRAALLLSDSSMFSMQADRMLREAGNPNRRASRHLHELETWLAEILTVPEKQALARYATRPSPG